MRIEQRRDFRIHWSEDPKAVALTRECLARVKKSGGLGVRDDLSPQDVQRVIDDLLLQVDPPEQSRHGERMSTFPINARVRTRRASSAYAALSGFRDEMVAG